MERVEDFADLGVDLFDEPVVTPAEGLPHLRVEIADRELGIGVIAGADAGHGVGLVAGRREIGRRGREFCGGRRRFADRAVVQFLAAREFADVVRIEKADDEEERLVVFLPKKFRGEHGVLSVNVAGFERFKAV